MGRGGLRAGLLAAICIGAVSVAWAQQPPKVTQVPAPKVVTPPAPAGQPPTMSIPLTPPLVRVTTTPASPAIILYPGMSKHVEVAKTFKTIHITDPNIVDVVVISDRTAILVPKNAGSTNIDFLGEGLPELLATVNVVVAVSEYAVPGRLKIHEGVASERTFSCVNGCDLVNEKASQVQAPAPPPPVRSVTQRESVSTRTGPGEVTTQERSISNQQ
jgi:hypothetical protein